MAQSFRALFATTICGALLGFSAPASADDRYIFLGDSLVDNQNSFIATKLVQPSNVVPLSPPYYQGRFSNGPNWTDQLAPTQLYYMDYYFSNPDCASENASNGLSGLCGSTTDPGAQEGVSLSFAFGGAKAGTEELPSAPGLLTVMDDLTAYNASGVVANTSGATFAILTGGNDYTNYVLGANPGVSEQGIVDQTLANIQTGIEQTAALGARRTIVLNLFDLDRVPTLVSAFNADQLAQSGQLSAAHNAGMPAMLANARANTGLEIILVDLDALYDDIDARPSLYGFTNTTGSCITNDVANGQCPDAASEAATLYWDGQHPTTTAHGYIAELVTATLQAVDADGGRLAALADSGLEQQRAVMSALRGQIHDLHGGPGFAGAGAAPVSSQEFGNSTVFVIAENGVGSRDKDGGFSGYDYDSQMAIAGVAYRPAETTRDIVFGAHLSYATMDSSINGGGSFDNNAVTVGGFGGWRSGAFSLGLQAGLSYHTVDDVKRDTGFSVMPTARSDTSGWGANAELEARWDNEVAIGQRRIGYAATGRLGAGWTTLDGFTESGASFLNLTVDDSDVAEVKAGVDFTVWTDVDNANGILQPYLGVGYERDLLDAEREIDGRLSSGQTIRADSRAAAQDLFNLTGGLRYLAPGGLRAELRVAASIGAGGEESFILPQLRIAKSF